MSQMFVIAKLASKARQVKPDALRQRETKSGGRIQATSGGVPGIAQVHRPQLFQPPGADPHAGWCGRGSVRYPDRPYPDFSGKASVGRQLMYDCRTLMSVVAAFTTYTVTPGMSHSCRLSPFVIALKSVFKNTLNGRLLVEVGSS
jgi:hypothetical protein